MIRGVQLETDKPNLQTGVFEALSATNGGITSR